MVSCKSFLQDRPWELFNGWVPQFSTRIITDWCCQRPWTSWFIGDLGIGIPRMVEHSWTINHIWNHPPTSPTRLSLLFLSHAPHSSANWLVQWTCSLQWPYRLLPWVAASSQPDQRSQNSGLCIPGLWRDGSIQTNPAPRPTRGCLNWTAYRNYE